MELTHPGFNYSVLSEFRDRVLEGTAELQLLDQMLEEFQTRGLLKARGTQRSDSTQVLSVAREMTRLEFLGETLRCALNTLAEVAPSWLQSQVPIEWYDRYSRRFEDSRLPKSPERRTQQAAQIGADGFYLLDCIDADSTPMSWRTLPAVEVLRQVWLQQYYAPGETIRLREAKDSAPGSIRIRVSRQLP